MVYLQRIKIILYRTIDCVDLIVYYLWLNCRKLETISGGIRASNENVLKMNTLKLI